MKTNLHINKHVKFKFVNIRIMSYLSYASDIKSNNIARPIVRGKTQMQKLQKNQKLQKFKNAKVLRSQKNQKMQKYKSAKVQKNLKVQLRGIYRF